MIGDHVSSGAAARTVAGVEITPAHRRISWGAVFGGVVLAFAISLLLALLGVGIGLTTIDPQQAGGTPSAASLGIGAAIWWMVSTLIAMVVGGYTAARLAGVTARGDGVLHGLITWAFSLLLTFYLLTTAMGAIIGGGFNTLQSVIGGAARATPQLAEATDIGAEQIDRLIARVAPDANETQIRQAREELTDLAPRFLQGGQEARQAQDEAIQVLSRTLGVPAEEIRAEATQAMQEFEGQARQTADQAANTASSAAIWSFVALALGAAAAAFGGLRGTRGQHAVGLAGSQTAPLV